MKTQDKVLEEILTKAKEIAPNFSWVSKTPQTDILSAGSPQFWALYTLVEYIKAITGFSNFGDITTLLKNNLKLILDLTTDELDSLLENDLDNLADLWGYERIEEQVAHGTFRFVFTSSNLVTIGEGVSIRSTAGINYKTSQLVTAIPSNKGDGYLSIDVLCESTESGVEGNVAEGSHFDLVDTSISNFSYAFPIEDINNGVSAETNTNFIERIQLTRAQRGVPSRTWLINTLLKDPRVYNLKIIGLGEENFYRSYGADVWIYGEEVPISIEESFTTESIEGTCAHVLKNVPLINKDPISEYPPGAYTFQVNELDPEGEEYGGSVNAIVYVSWSGACGVSEGTIKYKYDSTISDLQEMLVDPRYWLLGGRDVVLIKKAFGKYIDVNVRIKIEGGYIFNDVKSNVQHDLFVYIYGGLATSGVVYPRQTFVSEIQKSDLLNVVLDSEGVDQVNLSLFKMKFSDSTDWSGESLEFEYNQYPEIDITDEVSVVIEEMV